LNRRLTGLDLPASEIGSIVGNRELDVMHRPGIIAREVRTSGTQGTTKSTRDFECAFKETCARTRCCIVKTEKALLDCLASRRLASLSAT